MVEGRVGDHPAHRVPRPESAKVAPLIQAYCRVSKDHPGWSGILPKAALVHFLEESLQGKDLDPVFRLLPVPAQVDQDLPGEPRKIPQGAETGGVALLETVRRFDLDGDLLLPLPQEKVHLLPGGKVDGPVTPVVEEFPVFFVRPENDGHPPFQQASLLLRARRTQGAPDRPGKPRIHPVELGMLSFPDLLFQGEGGKLEGDQRIFGDLQVTLDRRPGHPGVSREGRKVQNLGVEKGQDGKETGETGEVSDQGLRLDFFLQIHLDVCDQGVGLVRRLPDHGKGPVTKNLFQVEVPAQFGGEKGKHEAADRPARQEVGSLFFELSGAGTAKDEAVPLALHEAVDLVEEEGKALDLVQDDRGAGSQGPELPAKEARVGQEVLVDL